MIVNGIILEFQRNQVTLQIEGVDVCWEIVNKSVRDVEIRFNDGRSISNEQRNKAHALIRDIALWSGDDPQWIKDYMKFAFCWRNNAPQFSLSDCDMTTAKEFINYLVEFCLRNDVPCMDAMLNRTDDIGRYLYMCLYYRKCCISGRPAQVHHVDRIGMGRDREEIVHVGLLAMALSPEWHDAVHRKGEKEIFEKYKIYGIKLDEKLCQRLRLGRKPDA